MGRGGRSGGRRPRWRLGADVALPSAAALTCGLVLVGTLLTPHQAPPRAPLAFPIPDLANGVATGRATVPRRVAGRGHRGIVAAWPIADGTGKKILLRDHAQAEVLNSERFGAPFWPGGGARARPGRGVPWLRRSGDVWPAASPPANAGPRVDTRGPGSSADSSVAADTCSRTLCGSRSAGVVAAVWRQAGGWIYRGGRPWEARLPREKLGENAPTFSPSVIKMPMRRLPANLRQTAGTRQTTKRFSKRASSKKTRRSGSSGGAHQTIKTGSDFSTGPSDVHPVTIAPEWAHG
jgi:hypothetical protein